MRALYGATPVHALAHLAALALAGFAVLHLAQARDAANVLLWFVGAIVLHDFLLLPLYTVLDRVAQLGTRNLERASGVRVINHLRVPAGISLLLLLVFFPSVCGRNTRNLAGVGGVEPEGYLERWLLASALLFGVSLLLLLVRLARAGALPSRPGAHAPRVLLWLAAGAATGLVAGLAVGLVRAPQVAEGATATLPWILLCAVPGAVIGALGAASAPAALARGLLVGLLWWATWTLTLAPLLDGEPLTWDMDAVRAGFADLVASGLHGGLAGALWVLVAPRLPARSPAERAAAADLPRVVVLGGGFAGVAVAQRLERLARHHPRWDVTLVSEGNFLLFTPMLPEVAGGALEARHIAAPLRAACPRTRVLQGRAEGIDLEARTVAVRSGERELELRFDHLVLALGAEPSLQRVPGVVEHALPLASLADAEAAREHLLGRMQAADLEADPAERAALLTFAVVGGGFAGVEGVAELRDLAHRVMRYFPSLEPGDLRFVLVHSGARVLPELGPELADFTLEHLRGRGVEVLLGTRVERVREDALVLATGREIATRTVVWTAGNRPNRLVEDVAVERSRAGAVVVDETLRVPGVPGLWAAGDCASVPDHHGSTHPPTAQHALREGRALADNLAAVLAGAEPEPLRFETLGSLAALGHRSGVAEIRGVRFSGALAWAMWRAIYLMKLPGLEKRVRVALDWLLDIAFPRDIVLARRADPVAERRREALLAERRETV